MNCEMFIRTVMAALILFCNNINEYDFNSYDDSLGSANTLKGNTLIISVFVSDENYSWDQQSMTDRQTIKDINTYLGTAADFLCSSARKYGAKADFIYDFERYTDISFFTSFNTDTADTDHAEEYMNSYIKNNIPSDELRIKYKADNIIYFIFVNTDKNFDGCSCTRNYYEGMEYPYEIVFLYNIDSGTKNCPAVYAHEILHTFGAPDLYYEDSEYGIKEKFLNYVSKNMPNDIMYYCSDIETDEYIYDRITNELSDLDAYYIGLTDQCPLIKDFGLGESQHIKK